MAYPKLGNRYKFIKELGSGGFGVVNLALDTHSGFLVAVKTLHQKLDEDSPIIRKFKIEANIYLGLNHPNIVQLKAPGLIVKDNQMHLVMENVDGLTLDKYMDEVTGPIPLKICLNLFKQIVSAIGFAHRKKVSIEGYNGVLHLDIKPNNIFILPNGTVKVIDYGVSQGGDEEIADGYGTIMYMAPEQLKKSNLDKRADIYALGNLLHYMTTHHHPHFGNSQQEIAYKVVHSKSERITNLYPAAESKFQFIIDKATQKNPEDRFQSCEEMVKYLDAIKTNKN